MALQTFTAGQVLTATQVNNLQANDYNQTVSTKTDSYVLTAADKGTRVVMNKATATTITVNTSLFAAGDTLWIHNIGAGVCTITAGTATVSTSGSLALAQNAGGTLYFTSTGVAIFFPTVASSAQGLTLLSTVAFSAVASQSINDVFSATYTNYQILVKASCSSATQLSLRMRVSGSDLTSSSYMYGGSYTQFTGAATPGAENATPTTAAGFNVLDVDGNPGYASIQIFDPFATEQTGLIYDQIFNQGGSRNNGYWQAFSGLTTVTTSYTGFTLLPAAGNITGYVRVYGYNQ